MAIKHFVNASDLTKADYDEIIRRFNIFITKGIPTDLLKGKVVATLFFQPSTRTMNMFQSAAIRAGGGWIGVMGEQGISMEKGETLEDTASEYSGFADAIVIRHPDDDSAERAARAAHVPVINAGSGSREHAISAALMLPILSHYLKKPVEGLKIGIYGTPEINRVCKALVPIMGLYGIELYIDDLGEFPLPKEVEERTRANGIKKLEYAPIQNWIGIVDALLVTRGLQKGIISADKFPKEKEDAILKKYKPINMELVSKMRKDAIVYMIKPLIFEIDRAVDKDPRAVYAHPEPYTETALAILTFLWSIPV